MKCVTALTVVLAAFGSQLLFASPRFEIVGDFRLPAEARWALDVRWVGEDEIAVAAGRRGVMRFRIGQRLSEVARAVPPEHTKGGFFFASRLAWSPRYLVTGSPFGLIGWKRSASASGIEGSVPFATTIDLDVHGDAVVILGANRDTNGRWAPEGAIAWGGTLSSQMKDLHPILFTHLPPAKDGVKARNVSDCLVMEMGAVRFLSDGSFIIVPGVEPGAFLYDSSERLVRTWQTGSLGFEDGCRLSSTEIGLYQRSVSSRDEWLNRHVIVDDILPLGSSPALVLRSVTRNRVKWTLLVLHNDGSTVTVGLPLTSASSLSHIRADVRGRRLVFLVQEHGEGTPRAWPRIVVATLSESQ